MSDWTNIDSRQVGSVQYVTPTTGATVTVNATGKVALLINPAGTLLALTVALPGSPSDGDVVTISSSQIITGLTISEGRLRVTYITPPLPNGGGLDRRKYGLQTFWQKTATAQARSSWYAHRHETQGKAEG